jgi:hypothetical protein
LISKSNIFEPKNKNALRYINTHPDFLINYVNQNTKNRDAKLGFTFASLGLHPVRPSPFPLSPAYAYIHSHHLVFPFLKHKITMQGMAATHFLPRLLPHQIATRLLLTGEVVSGEEAQRLGLVAESVPQVCEMVVYKNQ